jgi:hypothetical protein
MEMGGQFHVPTALLAVCFGYDIGRTQEPVWSTWRGDGFSSSRDWNPDPSAIQPVASRYTYWAIPVPFNDIYFSELKGLGKCKQYVVVSDISNKSCGIILIASLVQ